MDIHAELADVARELRTMRLADPHAADRALARTASRLEALAALERIAPDPEMRLADGLDPLILNAIPSMVVGHPYRLTARLVRQRSAAPMLLIESLTLMPEDTE